MAIFTDQILLDILGIFTGLIAVIYAIFKWKYQYWKNRNVPYFEPSIPFGNLPNPFTNSVHFGKQFANLYKQARAKGWKHLGMYLTLRVTYIPVDLDLIKNIMAKDFSHFVDRGLYTNERDDPVGAHLFSLGGVKWRNLRAKLSPTFTSGKLKSMFQTLVDCGLILEKHLEASLDTNQAVDIKEVLGCFSTDIIGSCAFGLDCNSFKDPDSPFRIYGRKIFQSRGRFLGFIRQFIMGSHKLARALKMRLVPKDVSDFFTKMVQDTVDYRLKNNYVRNDFLQLLIDMMEKNGERKEGTGDGNTLTMNEMVAQSFVFFIAGFETSSTTMTFALYELATHPEVQDKVREEIETVLAKHDNKITYDSLSELKYMGQVIDEALRMYPPVPVLQRCCVEEYKVPGEDVVIEKGTRLIIPVLGIHYDKQYYKNPKVFDPERFNDENKKTRHPYAHLPFGEGPRICIGQRFGIMQSKVGLTCLLRKFKVTLSDKTKVPLKMELKSFIPAAEGGIWLNIEKI